MVRGNVEIKQVGAMNFAIIESDLVFANDEVMIEVKKVGTQMVVQCLYGC